MQSKLEGGAMAVLLCASLVAASTIASAQTPDAKGQAVKRGQYLVDYGGCNDCHTPKVMSPQGPLPDRSRLLSGHRADAPVAPVPADVLGPARWGALTNDDLTAWAGPWGISFAANLTPDKATGLGGWSYAQFRDTMRHGKHLGAGRDLLPPMPWMNVAVLDDADLRALFAYLRSLKPIENRVPAPIAPK
jgi:mono/diheme cytochrome c family protein